MTPTEHPTAWWVPAMRECELGEAGTPEWVALAEQAFALAGDEHSSPRPDAASRHRDDRSAAEAHFASVVASFVTAAMLRLSPEVAPSVAAGVGEELVHSLTRIAARSLVAELHRQLGGQGGPGEFTAAVRTMATEQGLRALAERYPVLIRLLATQAAGRVAAVEELLARFGEDRAEVIARLLDGTDPGRIAGVDSGAGDTHRNGRSVCVLRFADGRRVVYKPRSLAVHEVVRAILDLVDDDLGLGLPSVPVLCRDGYGWMAFVHAAECRGPEDVALFFRRLGALLAVLHALRTTDLHCENVIAAGAEPLLLDLETVAHPDLMAAGPGTDPAWRGLEKSVLRTAMLPRHSAGLDLSGFGGAPGIIQDSVHYAEAGLPSMQLVRGPRSYPGALNRPTLNGAPVGAAGYVADVTAGFRLGYDSVARHADELLAADGLIAQLCGLAGRVVLRNTKVYARLLDECTHPQVLSDAAAREHVLRQLVEHGHGGSPALIDSEVAQLWCGDVPMFCTRPNRSGVFSDDGDEPVRADVAPADVPYTIRSLSAADRERQVWVIEAALLSGYARPEFSPAPPTGEDAPDLHGDWPHSADLVTAAMVLGDRLIAEAFDDGARCNWVSLYRHPDAGNSVLPMGMDLGNGYLGVSLFLAQLADIGGAGRHRDCARRALAEVDSRLATLADQPTAPEVVGPGAFHGLGGVVYSLYQLSLLDGAAVSPGALPAAVQLLDRAAATEDPCVATGRAGGLLALLNLHAAGHPGAGERAQRWAERLVPDASVPTRLGLFHGRLGVIWALARAARQLEHPALRRRADELLDAFPSERLAGLGVAEGLGGLAVVHAELDPESFTARRISQRLADAAGANRDDSLAEGWLGVADIALARDGGLLPRHARRVSRLADEITHDSRLLRCGTPGGLAVPGFLHGLAGIGHALLRLHDQTAVASALTLDGPSPAPEHAPTCVNSASCV